MHPINLGSRMMLKNFMFIFTVPSRRMLNLTQFILCILHSECLRAQAKRIRSAIHKALTLQHVPCLDVLILQ
jgi:hypothetical protein